MEQGWDHVFCNTSLVLIDRLWHDGARIYNSIFGFIPSVMVSVSVKQTGEVIRGYLVPSSLIQCQKRRWPLHRPSGNVQQRGVAAKVRSSGFVAIYQALFVLHVPVQDPLSHADLQVSSMTSSSRTPAGILPSLISFSNLATSARLLALRMSASTLAFSLSFSLTRGCFELPLERGAV